MELWSVPEFYNFRMDEDIYNNNNAFLVNLQYIPNINFWNTRMIVMIALVH